MKLLLQVKLVLCLALFLNTQLAHAQRFVEFGGGFSPFSESHVVDAVTNQPPIHAYLSYGTFLGRYSITARYDFNSQYQLENYELNPQYFGLFLDRNFLSIGGYSYELQFIGSAGVVFEQHRFLDRGNSQVPGYELEEEKASGPGFAGRAGGKLLVGNWTGGLFAEVFRSQQDFIAGQFERQTFQTGSTRFTISIGYRLNREKNEIICPTYY